MPMSAMPPPALLAHDLVRVLGVRRVLDGLSFTAAPGHRIGLIGDNGVGKSTLLRLLAGLDRPDAGTVTRPDDVGFLHQELPFAPGATIADVLADAVRDARDDLAELDRLAAALADAPQDEGLPAAYADRLDRAQHRDAWDADRRAALVFGGLGLAALPAERPLGSLSGGQRGRLALAALLVRRPSALLLDEPTNHLDDEAMAFVEGHLRALPGVVVVASHDRAFLDAVCTDLVDLDPALGGPTRFGGGYTAYVARKRADRERWRRRHADEEEELAALRHAAQDTAHQVAPNREKRDNEKMGYGHSGGRVQNQIARRVRNATRRLETLERTRVPEPPRPLEFRPAGLATWEGAEDAVSLHGVHVPGRLAVEHLVVAQGERLLVTGANGAGKSTLRAVLAGTLWHGGQVRRRPGLTVGLLAQDTAFDHPDRTARETYERVLGPERAEAVPLTSLGLLGDRDLDTAVGWLSAGQRRRLGLALLVADPPELLLLDEPTNHLARPCATSWRTRWARVPARSSWPATTGGCAAGGGARRSGWPGVPWSGRARRERQRDTPVQQASFCLSTRRAASSTRVAGRVPAATEASRWSSTSPARPPLDHSAMSAPAASAWRTASGRSTRSVTARIAPRSSVIAGPVKPNSPRSSAYASGLSVAGRPPVRPGTSMCPSITTTRP
ncbi:ABC-type antibiotic transporter, ATPase subunit [Saccharothrix espanaensis DSM 44229]|uniref:ABC-type antibiotic transporter, ATPase subunit n=1 Tax=Saccharothrix espanaensis (strain ATCC 51144 / DSM 44229 / JCM 9112 / NBRC 15066 / NRRL 15764) TaxID=1179773 RepID=K0JTQ0_SACES|nr:ABC-type antibiotic transporter, ATPase subunit [Saccharothrix espanaensis DSM 44229]